MERGEEGGRKMKYNFYICQILSKCEQEIRFDRAIEEGDILSARKHLSHIQSLDKGEGLFR